MLAGELGFEPRQTESESVVLPLHHSPILKQLHILKRNTCSSRDGSGGACASVRPSTRKLPALASAREWGSCHWTAGRPPSSRASSSEVDTGSRQENASNQEAGAPFRFNRNGKGSSHSPDARAAPPRLSLIH